MRITSVSRVSQTAHVSCKWEKRKGAQNHMRITRASSISRSYRMRIAHTGQISLEGPSRSSLPFFLPGPFFLGEPSVVFEQIKLYHTRIATYRTKRSRIAVSTQNMRRAYQRCKCVSEAYRMRIAQNARISRTGSRSSCCRCQTLSRGSLACQPRCHPASWRGP